MKNFTQSCAPSTLLRPGLSAQSYMAAFLTHLATERRLSPHTVKNYGRDISALLTCAPPLGELSEHDIRRSIATLRGRGLSGRSLARMLSAWRAFFVYLMRDHGFERNPVLGIRAPKTPKTLPSALSPDAASHLMDIEPDDALSVRDKAIYELFYSSGLRLAELIALTPEDVRDGMVKVTGKGSKMRLVPVGSHAHKALEEWFVVRAQLVKPGEKALFINARGTRLSPRAIQTRMRTWALKLGLAQNVHPHMLRHSFASHVLQSSSDLRAVQEMLGHASIASTQVYSHLDFQALSKVYDKAHPRARKKTS